MSSGRDMGEDIDTINELLVERISWYPVAKKEFQDTIRSRGFLLLSLVFSVFFIMPAAGALYLGLDLGPRLQKVETQLLISTVYLNIVTVFVPIVTIFVGYAAIARERTSGSLKLLLSQPYTRRDVVIGKVAGRALVVAVPLALAFLLTGLFIVASELTFKPEMYGLFVLFSTGFAVVFVSIAVSISGAVSTSFRSAVASVFVYFYFTFAWNSLANGLGNLLSNQLAVPDGVRWHVVLFTKLINPSQAYKTLMNSMLGDGANAARSARYGMFSQDPQQMRTICTGLLNGNATIQRGLLGNRTVCAEPAAGTGIPAYFSDPAVFLYLLLWIGVAATISYYTFDRFDL
ncbi:MAG: ABC transporter permease subunit [Haloarculaceae archaeon]